MAFNSADFISTETGPDFVQSLARGIAVMRAFDAEHPILSLSEVAARARIPAASARRFLRTLESLGYVTSERKQFRLTPRVLDIGYGYLSSLTLPEVIQPHLETLTRELDESASASVLDGSDIVYVARVAARRIMSVSITIGTRFPAHATSMGRVLLAALPPADIQPLIASASAISRGTITDPALLTREINRVREQGWAMVDGELETGLRSIAAPVRAKNGQTVAAVNVSTSTSRVSEMELLERHLPLLIDTVQRVENDLQQMP